ncbi:hypothetical protein M407DRAFT_16289 [Tulasnella calospora MUT 4182]|uniref:Clp R domain-containing protein n=1 Tax=Tulasnella calospora MUT 4182 TaxID=1051891 RepID=A0A0C3Q440_9AGAM|nr:hypothetical protein M407DRAFT_16289 [Tulasnella calospora MUT 4182]
MKTKKDANSLVPPTPDRSLLSLPRSRSTSPLPPLTVPGASDRLVEASKAVEEIVSEARALKKEMGDFYIAPEHFVLALLKDPTIEPFLSDRGIQAFYLSKVVSDMRRGPIKSKKAGQKLEALKTFGVDLTAKAEAGELDPVIGRDSELRRVIRILCRRTKNSPVLVGEPGVGKTAIAEALAQRIVEKDVPASLSGRIYALDMGALIAGTTSRGDYEERIKNILDEVSRSEEAGEPIILFIDELHLIMAGKSQGGNNGGMDAANLFKPALARGKLRCMGATTLAEYREHIEKDGALERRFAMVIVKEPSVEDTISILRGVQEKYEKHHGVIIRQAALVTAAQLAHRYITQRRLPDSAVDLIDEACAAAKVARETVPDELDSLERHHDRLLWEIEHLKTAATEGDSKGQEKLCNARKEHDEIQMRIESLPEAILEHRKRRKRIVELRKSIVRRKMEWRGVGSDPLIPSKRQAKDLTELINQDEEELKELESSGNTAPFITSEDIAAVVERSTKIPVKRLMAADKEDLLDLEARLREKVVGQSQAIIAVTRAIQRSRNGLGNSTRPIASFLFTGVSGTGKTHLAKKLAELLFQSENAMVRIDGSEYGASHSTSRLIGSPPGYVGFEQGGQLTEYIRRNPYSIVLIDEIEKACSEFETLFLQVLDDGRLTDGQGRVVDFRNTVIIMTSNLGYDILARSNSTGASDDQYEDSVAMNAITTHFSPEFINRLDDIIIFRKFAPEDAKKVVDLRIKETAEVLEKRNLHLDLDDAAKQSLADVIVESKYGARPLNREIQTRIINELSTYLLQDIIQDGEVVKPNRGTGSPIGRVSEKDDAHPSSSGTFSSPKRDWSRGLFGGGLYRKATQHATNAMPGPSPRVAHP